MLEHRRPQTVTARDTHLLPFLADQPVHALSHSRFESNAKYISDTCFPPDRAHFLETAFNSSFINTRSSIAAVHHLAPNTHQTSILDAMQLSLPSPATALNCYSPKDSYSDRLIPNTLYFSEVRVTQLLLL